jgi:hypothetical protein
MRVSVCASGVPLNESLHCPSELPEGDALRSCLLPPLCGMPDGDDGADACGRRDRPTDLLSNDLLEGDGELPPLPPPPSGTPADATLYACSSVNVPSSTSICNETGSTTRFSASNAATGVALDTPPTAPPECTSETRPSMGVIAAGVVADAVAYLMVDGTGDDSGARRGSVSVGTARNDDDDGDSDSERDAAENSRPLLRGAGDSLLLDVCEVSPLEPGVVVVWVVRW